MEDIIDIHPLDMHIMMNEFDEPTDIIIKKSAGEELVEIKGQLYRQTVLASRK
jgi:hypothetical protein